MLADGIESVEAVKDGAQFDCYATSYRDSEMKWALVGRAISSVRGLLQVARVVRRITHARLDFIVATLIFRCYIPYP